MHWINGELYTTAGYYAWHIGGAITPTLCLLGYIGFIALVVRFSRQKDTADAR